jgi:hypothetical protein
MRNKLSFRFFIVLSLLLATLPAQAAPADSTTPTKLPQFITLGTYNPASTLTIDPLLVWNTFLGGSGSDRGYAITVDGSGNVYVTGTTWSNWGDPLQSYTGGGDAFVAKLDSSGAPIWNTFLGGDWEERGNAITMDGSGNVYVTGQSAGTWGDPVHAYSGAWDIFVARLDASTGTLDWNTFLGEAYWDYGNGIDVDESGNVYVAGSAYGSIGMSNTWGVDPVRSFSGGTYDAFAAKVDASSGALTWYTYLGGGGVDNGNAIAVNGDGHILVAGGTGGSSAVWGCPPITPCTVRAYTATASGDAFVASLDASGALAWNTFLGGDGYESGSGIILDGDDNIYIAGPSGDWGGPVRAYSSGVDAFAARLDPSGALTWNTFLGGSGADRGTAIALDGSGNIYVSGASNVGWGSPARAFTASENDAFAAQLSNTGTLIWNTFLGGSGYDYGYNIAVYGNGNAYVIGFSTTSWGSPIGNYNANEDAFIANISPSRSISGKAGVAGATLSYTGGTTIADEDGDYSINVPDGWSGTVTPSKAGYSFEPVSQTYIPVTVDKPDENYTATLIEYTLTIASEHGTVTKSPDRATYHYGDMVELTAAPGTGWSFANWTGDLIGSDNPDSVSILGNTSVTANYTLIIHRIYLPLVPRN